MNPIDRRTLLSSSLLGAGALPFVTHAAAASSAATTSAAAAVNAAHGRSAIAADRYIIDDTSAVADTTSGKVAGYIHNDIRVFKGIPYGSIDAPQGRWMRAAPAKPWSGVRGSRAAGPGCPPVAGGGGGGGGDPLDEMSFRSSGNQIQRFSEECLRLNIWTPGLDNRKRQVLFYCHGGGYHSGSSLMGAFYDGTNLASYGDVVVVSVNHRLQAFGFLDLSAYGSRWADSANIGMLDLVDALKWVRTHIANFGGDPAKVMIFGHSGGGSKVLTLVAMPEAKGLFTRAVAQSAGPQPLATPEDSARRTAAFLKAVDVSPANMDALLKLTPDAISQAAARTGAGTPAGRDIWRPVVDGRTVAYEPTRPTQPSSMPLMIGTAMQEFTTALGHPEYLQMPEAEARELVRKSFGASGDEIYAVYRATMAQATPFDVAATALSLGRMRGFAVKIAQNRATAGAAPTYLYWFQWRSSNLGGRAMSHHELEMPLVFQNSDLAPEFTGATAEARALSLKMTDAWLAFARTGNPNVASLPRWQPVSAVRPESMVFDNNCRIDPASDLAAVDLFWKGDPHNP